MINYRNQKFSFLLILVILFFSSCSRNQDSDIIEREEFIKVLTDLNIAEGIMTTKTWNDVSLNDSSKSYYNFVLRKYNLSRSKFDNSLAYYSKDLEDLESMYDEIIVNINNEMPKKLNVKSVYNFIGESIEEAKMKIDPVKRFGFSGIELWTQNTFVNFPGDTARSMLKLDKEIKHQCLLILKAEFMIMPKNKSKKMKMNLMVNYKDTTADTIEKLIKWKNGKWENCYLVLKTDSSKIPVKVKSTVFETDSITSKTLVSIRNISLRQYAPKKDTTGMFIKPKLQPIKKVIPKRKLPKAGGNEVIN